MDKKLESLILDVDREATCLQDNMQGLLPIDDPEQARHNAVEHIKDTMEILRELREQLLDL